MLLPYDCFRTLLLKFHKIKLCTSKRTSIQWVIGKQSLKLKFTSTFTFCFFELDLSTGKSMFAMGEWVDCQRWLKKSKVWSTTQNKKKIEFFQPTVQTLDYKIAYVRWERLKGLKAVCASSNKSWKKNTFDYKVNNILISKLLCEIDIVKILQWIFFSQNVFCCFVISRHLSLFLWILFLLQKRTYFIQLFKDAKNTWQFHNTRNLH